MRRLLLATAVLLSATAARAQTCHLSYGNGALIPNVKVVALYWGTTNNGQYKYKDQLHQYYDAVTNSAYFDWLERVQRRRLLDRPRRLRRGVRRPVAAGEGDDRRDQRPAAVDLGAHRRRQDPGA